MAFKLGNKRIIEGMMADVRVREVVISREMMNDAVEELPVFDVIRRWLELIDDEQIIEGVNVIRTLKELVELNAQLIEGRNNQQAQANLKIEELLR